MSNTGRRGTIAPIIKRPDGSWDWAVPQIALDAWDGITAPYDAYIGALDPMSPEATRRAVNGAGLALGAPAVGAAERAAATAAGREAVDTAGALFTKGPVEYASPRYPTRPFKADYPGEVPSDATGKLTADVDGRPLVARHVAGRRVAEGPDRPLTTGDMADVAESGTGTRVAFAPRGDIEGASGGVRVDLSGRPLRVLLADDIHTRDIPAVLAHETGHVVSQIAGRIPTDGLEDELAQIYHAQHTGERWSAKPLTPKDIGYSPEAAPQEYMAEALRFYMMDPNSLKYAAPRTAARIREFVNGNPDLNQFIQFNQGGAPGAAAGVASWPDNSREERISRALAAGAPARPKPSQTLLDAIFGR